MSWPDDAGHPLRTLVDLLTRRAEQRGDTLAFTFSRDGDENETSQVTYRELDQRARQIAADLQRDGAAGERVLVLCPPGLDFLASFFGCLYAGALAIPVHPPMREHLVPRVASIIADVQPQFALTTAEIEPRIKPAIDDLPGGQALRWSIVDVDVSASAADWVPPQIDGDTVAMLQYTSGSTSAPKGVVLTHGNLVHNLLTIAEVWNPTPEMRVQGVFWLPPYHDMGLIGGLLGTMYAAGTSVLMPPTAFIKRPMRWLEAISRHRAMITAAPNFAFDLCVELSTPQERAALDLSHWTVALCGAEPVRTASMDAFVEAFGPAGFRRESLFPVYGLAEGTLLVSGGSDSAVPVVHHVDRIAMRDNRILEVDPSDPTATTLVGCGKPRGGQRVAIVDPETRLACGPDEVGEIWVCGPSVAHGYWAAPELSAETFAATLADTDEGPFLRTGDLGFLRSGELFVTGRRKDLIIIRGNNHYPNDIELTVQNTNPALLRGRGAVFSVAPESGAAEQLVVVQEVDPSRLDAAQLEDAMQAIRTVITENHAVRTHAVVLVQPLQLPTTSSGKIQRSACKQKYLDGELPVVAAWPAANAAPQAAPQPPAAKAAEAQTAAGPRSAAEISAWLIGQLSQDLELPAAEMDPAKPFAYYGLDSIHAVRLSSALEKWLGCELAPTIAYEYPSIDILSAHLARVTAKTPAVSAAVAAAPTERPAADEPIAIVGIGCRFPGADGPEEFWRLLSAGVDATSEVPADRWDVDAFYNPDPAVPGTAVTRRGGFLDRVDQFDYQFFGISPRESAQMDPQQRLLLEVAWEALEDAGQAPETLAGSRTGVFVGISTNDYGFLRLGQPQLVDAYTGTGNALSIAANRLSYTFDFHGPSLSVDTACSSSLVAVDLACRSLRDGECSMALAAGVNVILSPALAINFSKARVMAPDGRCKTFDADADGYVRGEGAGVVILKPLSRALEDNDPIYAVIRGSATNSDGRTNGLIAPSGRAQEGVLAEAYRRAGLPAGSVQYVEAHGTGTSIGDAIEANALGAVLAENRPQGNRCLVGSVKTNIGHLEAAAGVAGLIKVALSLQHRAIPASLNFTEPNPHIDFDRLPLEVVQTLTPWPAGSRAVAGVSSFGFGGTNAHIVLTEAPQVRSGYSDDAAPARAELLALSARSPEALTALVGEYEMALFSGGLEGGRFLTDLCYTAGARRGHHDYRLSVVGDSPAALFESLSAYRQGESRPGLSVGHCSGAGAVRARNVTFVFSGQGSQWHGMAQRLRADEPVFADALAACDTALLPHLGHSILKALAAQDGPEDRSKLTDIGILQPTIFAIQVALAALWRSWGVEPAAVVGHSLGEVAAAHVAGALSLEDAARVICARARMLRGVRGRGAMMVTETTMAEAQQLIAGREQQVAVAASNSYRSTVLAGERKVLEELMAKLTARDRFCRWIEVDVASHSPQMAALGAGLRGSLVKLKPTAPTTPMYSTVTGELVGEKLLDADYWVSNLCSPVRFSPALRRLLETGHDTFVELSPHPILLTGAREDAEHVHRSATLLPSMRRDDEGRSTMLGSLGTLYALGHRVAWEQIYPAGSRLVPAPTYPWQRVHSWLNAGSIAAPRHGGTGAPGGWRGPIRSAAQPATVLTELDITTGALTAEQLGELALTAAEVAFGPGGRSVIDLSLCGNPAQVQTVQFALTDGSFECYARAADALADGAEWSLLATGTIATGTNSAGTNAAASAVSADPRERIYQVRWQPSSLDNDSPGRSDGRPAEPGSWLILSDGPVADTLRDHLEAQAQSCVLVEPVVGLAEIERVSADSYRIDPARPEHFGELLRAAFGGDRPPCRGVVHLWNLLDASPAETTDETLATATTVGSLSVVHLIQALTLAGWSESPRLWLVTRGAQATGSEQGAELNALSVGQAPVWGLGRSIDHEHPELRATGVDLSAGGGPEELRGLFSEIWSDSGEADVALRGHRRHVARLERYDDGQSGQPVQVRGCVEQATYLVTGGLGAVGGKVAGWLVERGARHLVLTGRSAPSATAEATLDALRAAGAEVTVARADVTKSEDVAAVLAMIDSTMPPLRGVVHAAGTVDDAILAQLDAPKLRAVMAPKVQGAWNLHTQTADAQLDFFVLFSSAASVLGSPGAANYGAANAFLDALAWHRRAAGQPALSVNFGPWAGLGMFTNSDLQRHFAHYGVEGMSADDYFAALEVLLDGATPQAMVLDIDWPRWRPNAHPSLLADLQPADVADGALPTGGLYDAVQAADPQERQQLLESYLRDLVAGKLGLPPAGLDMVAPLNSLGVDSLITLELRIQVERELGLVVPVARLLDGPSVTSLAGWLADQLAAGSGRSATPETVVGQDVPEVSQEAAAPEMELLAQMSDLSDDAVDALLQKMLADGDQVKDGG